MKNQIGYITLLAWIILSSIFIYDLSFSQSKDTIRAQYNIQPKFMIPITERLIFAPIAHLEGGMPLGIATSTRILYGMKYFADTTSWDVAHYLNISASPGLHGYRFSLGYMFLGEGVGRNLQIFVVEPRISLFRTWQDFRFSRANETYIGVEIGFLQMCMGYFFHTVNSERGTSSFFSWQIFVGF
jgi:hypothetical protein